MTVSTKGRRHRFEPGSGMATEAIPFPYLAPEDLLVRLLFAGPEPVRLTRDLDFALGGDGVAKTGTIKPLRTFEDGQMIEVLRVTDLRQNAKIKPHEPLPAKETESQLDRQVMALQEADDNHFELRARSLQVPIGENVGTIPSVMTRAGRVLGFNSLGVPVAVPNTSVAVAADLLASSQLYTLTRNASDASTAASERSSGFANTALGHAASSAAYRDQALQALQQALQAVTDAGLAALIAPTLFATVAAGIAATTNGQAFAVAGADSNTSVVFYRNNAGSAAPVKSLPSLDLVLTFSSQLQRLANSKLYRIGRGIVPTNLVAGTSQTRIEGAAFGKTGLLRRLGTYVRTAGNGHVLLVRFNTDGTVNLVAQWYGMMEAGEFWIPGSAFAGLVDRRVTADLHAAFFVGTGGAGLDQLRDMPSGSSFVFTGLLQGNNNAVTAANAPVKFTAEIEADDVLDRVASLEGNIAVMEARDISKLRQPDAQIYQQPAGLPLVYTDQQRYNDQVAAISGQISAPTMRVPDNGYTQTGVFFNFNAANPVEQRGTTAYNRQPHAARSAGTAVNFFVEGRVGAAADSSPSRCIWKRSPDLGATIPSPVELITSSSLGTDGLVHENAVGNLSSGYHAASGRDWLAAKTRHPDTHVTVPDNCYAIFYDIAAGQWNGRDGPQSTFTDDQCISLEYLRPEGASYYAPPNSRLFSPKIGALRGRLLLPMRYTIGQVSGIQMLMLREDWLPGDPHPFIEMSRAFNVQAIDPRTGNLYIKDGATSPTFLDFGETSIAQLPTGDILTVSRDNGTTGTRLALRWSGVDLSLIGAKIDDGLRGQDMTGSLLELSGLGDGKPFRLLYAQNADVLAADSGTRAGACIRMARRIDLDGWPVWSESTGRLFPVNEVTVIDIRGNPSSTTFAQNNNAVSLYDITTNPDDPRWGMILDKKVRFGSPNNATAMFIASPKIEGGVGDFGRSAVIP